jgi:hypothetical protein
VLNNRTGLLVQVVPGAWPPKSSSNNRVCCPYVCSDTPLRALEYFRDQHSQVQPRSPHLQPSSKRCKNTSTVPLSLEIGVASIVRWKQHRTNGVLSSDQRRGYHKQTSQDALTSGHSQQPKLMTGLEMLTFLSWAPHRISLCFSCSCCCCCCCLPKCLIYLAHLLFYKYFTFLQSYKFF